MAVAGMPNLSAFGPSFFGESQSPMSGRWGDEIRPRTRASSLLQMWRELEGDHVVTSSGPRNGTNSEALSTTSASLGQGSDNENQEHEDNNSVISEQSSDLGESERERVRQIFQEWMKSGAMGNSSNALHLNNRSGPQWLGENECERVRIVREWVQMNAQQRNNQGSVRDGSQIEQVRNGLVVAHPEIGSRRPIRRLCGRQTLLDLLLRAQCERKVELQGLSEQRPVSDFPHRNRIQALLRGRFLRNERLVPEKRPSSVAATELGLLRQRHTVSDLREGFLSKLDNSASTSVNCAESDSSSRDENNGESEPTGIHTESDLERTAEGNTSQHEVVTQVTEEENHVLNSEATEPEVSADAEYTVSSHREDIDATVNQDSSSETEDVHGSGPHEEFHESYVSRSNSSYAHEVANEQFDQRDISMQVHDSHESVIEIEEMSRSWQQNAAANQWFHETSDNDAIVEQDQIQESNEDDLQEAIDSWLDMPSGEVGASMGRIPTIYFPDDDNTHTIELRELFSRRRVSSLLRSGFRESLDQVLQSHVERQGHISDDWEMDNAYSSTSLLEQDERGQNGNQTLVLSDDADRNPFVPTSNLVASSQSLWDEELQGANLPHNSSQHFGTEWEIINELRIDMARLQQRLNNMQSMLEACMDMQIELQRSVRQEVSAALNRSVLTRDADAPNRDTLHDESQWDHVRRGICCLCCESNINSLLYRCGHMCTCSKCAEKLVQGAGKCPMCQAPVVEAVRAYFTQ